MNPSKLTNRSRECRVPFIKNDNLWRALPEGGKHQRHNKRCPEGCCRRRRRVHVCRLSFLFSLFVHVLVKTKTKVKSKDLFDVQHFEMFERKEVLFPLYYHFHILKIKKNQIVLCKE